jgi:exopolysaccharide biosynthesis polyprenyl glycosylphosphotransferase
MIRTFDRYIALEMFGLWFVETLLIACVLYGLLAQHLWTAEFSTHFDQRALLQAGLCAVTISLTSVATGLYRPDICVRRGKLMITAMIVSLLATPVLTCLSNVMGLGLSLDPASDISLLKIIGGWIACLIVTRIAFHVAQRADLLARRILVIGSAQSAVRIQNIISASEGSFCRVVGVIAPEVAFPAGVTAFDPADLRRRKIWSVVVANDSVARLPQSPLPGSGQSAQSGGVQIFDEAEFCENRLQRLDTDNLPDSWGGVVQNATNRQAVEAVHRLLDIMISAALLLFTLPLMVLVAAAIRIESRGPVFYRQERVGRYGRVFMLRKFRSMAVDAEAVGKPVWAAAKDPRVTRVGRFIRRTRVDELPQLINVLAGEMSFIGPRPERPQFVRQLTAAIQHYADRECLKPGITGWAQVKFPYGASIEDARMKLAYDLYYVKHRSLFLNLMIMFATVRVILFQEGSR